MSVDSVALWYHTIDLGQGVETPGWFDLRPIADRMPWPDVRGKRCLDVGTWDGYLAFELERRGASEVVALDIPDHQDWDWPPDVRAQGGERLAELAGPEKGAGFRVAREAKGSAVEKVDMTVYDLSPERVGSFDVVLCGSLMLHLRDPLRALEAIRSVCTGQFLSSEQVSLALTLSHPRRPLARLNGSGPQLQWWVPNAAGHRRMLFAAGLRDPHRHAALLRALRTRAPRPPGRPAHPAQPARPAGGGRQPGSDPRSRADQAEGVTVREWKGTSVLVTGAQGFVGSWLAERLLHEGAKVVVPRRDVEPESRFRRDGIEERCVVVSADVQDYESMLRILNEHEIGAVFHLAAQTIVGTANRSPLSTFEANIRGTYVLLEACRATGVVGSGIDAVVVASSDKAYGSHDELPYREDFALQPRFPYDVSKACTDLIGRSYAHTYGLPVAVTRLANVYGGGDLNWSRVVPDTAQALVKGNRPVIRSDGTPERDYLYVEDAVEAYLAVAASVADERLRGRAWNAGWGEPCSVEDIVRRLIAASGRDRRAGHPGRGNPARGDRPPVPRLDGDPRGAGLGADGRLRRGPAAHVGVVRRAPGLTGQARALRSSTSISLSACPAPRATQVRGSSASRTVSPVSASRRSARPHSSAPPPASNRPRSARSEESSGGVSSSVPATAATISAASGSSASRSSALVIVTSRGRPLAGSRPRTVSFASRASGRTLPT